MKFKNNILVLTSIISDSSAVKSIESYFNRFYQNYNLIILNESQYGKEKNAIRQDNIHKRNMQNRPVIYRKFKTIGLKTTKKTDFSKLGERRSVSAKMRGTTKRIYNAIIRFCPDLILVTTPKTMHEVAVAKRKAKFKFPIIGLMNRFTVDRNFYSYHADGFIVENIDMKNHITSLGFPSNKVFVLGMPIQETMPTIDYIIKKKEQLGLNSNHTVYLSGGKIGSRDMMPVFELLLDQGNMINIVVDCGCNARLHAEILRKIDEIKAENIKVYIDTDAETTENILMAADCVMTTCDTELIYRAFLLNIPVIGYSPNDAVDKADFEYLESKKLIYYAHDNNFAIIGLYKMIQTNLSKRLVETANARTRPNALEEICDLIANYGTRSKND